MAKDYFIIEHEGHIIPDEEAKEWLPTNTDPEYKRFMASTGYIHKIVHMDPEFMAKMMEKMIPGGDPKPQPDFTIDLMDAAGVDVAMVVPHWHTLHMNVKHKGTNNDWVIEACEKFPDRLMPGPVFRPSIVGVKETMQEMEYLVKERGVKYCKIYPPGEKWNMSDERYFPVYSLAQELGLVLAFHTGHGYVYGANTEAGNPRHLETVCRNFYDLKILAFHFGWPWHQDLNCIAGCYPNLYIGMSFLNQTILNRPRFFAKLLGDAIMYAGVDKVIWSNDGHASKANVDAFRNFQFSKDLQEGYGYKALTEDDKAKIFGLNYAKLIGIEPRKRVG